MGHRNRSSDLVTLNFLQQIINDPNHQILVGPNAQQSFDQVKETILLALWAGEESIFTVPPRKKHTSPSFTPSSPFAFKTATASALCSLLCHLYTAPYYTRQLSAQCLAHRPRYTPAISTRTKRTAHLLDSMSPSRAEAVSRLTHQIYDARQMIFPRVRRAPD